MPRAVRSRATLVSILILAVVAPSRANTPISFRAAAPRAASILYVRAVTVSSYCSDCEVIQSLRGARLDHVVGGVLRGRPTKGAVTICALSFVNSGNSGTPLKEPQFGSFYLVLLDKAGNPLPSTDDDGGDYACGLMIRADLVRSVGRP